MRIGILTFHMAINYGAYWQAYALNKYIRDTFEAECYLINYESKYTFKKDIVKRIFKLNIIKSMYNLLAILNFRSGWKLMKKTKFSFDISSQNFDGYVLGSDEIWNYKNTFVEEGDNTYFGTGFEASRIVSFCPSFGAVNCNDKIPHEIAESIRRINPDNISVRDANSQYIIEKITGNKVPILVDPVFLNKYPKKHISRDKKFILVYGNNFSKEFVDSVKEVARQENAKIYSFGFVNTFADKNILFKSPIEILNYFDSAQYVFTNMYHGVVFSLYCQKQFFMQYNSSKQNKVDTLLNQIGLSDRIVYTKRDVFEMYKYIKEHPEDFTISIERLDLLIKQSKNFINSRISAIENMVLNKSSKGA